jgi:hypothetical protein
MIIMAALVIFWVFVFALLIGGVASLNPDNKDKDKDIWV